MMRSPAQESSESRDLPYLLKKEKRLRYNADGSHNLVEWVPDVIQLAKAAYPLFFRVLVDRAIPPEWETPFPNPDPLVYAAMDDYEKDVHRDDRQAYNKILASWKISKPSMCTGLMANASESSDKRVKEQHNAAWDAAKENDAIAELMNWKILINY